MGKPLLIEQTPLAIFVRERLAELGMKQSEFCRLTGFDQGSLSKIMSSMINTLSLETALRLSKGLCVSPKEILILVGRMDLYDLVVKTFGNDLPGTKWLGEAEVPEAVLEISRLAYDAHMEGRNLQPVLRTLCAINIRPREQDHRQAIGKFI
jgi:hypothetical protein